mmetsp:Transcript_25534/g.43065  ORF Transcript_25534/g.43065 Transcript_25534/m.43065 type:complete len:306 (-) Transcript_25534:178-1095(-)
MLKTPTRPKRSLECDTHCVDMESDYNNGASLAFASKRLCIEPLTSSGSTVPKHIANTQVSKYSIASSLAKSQSQDRGDMGEKADEDMDVGDEIVSNFNTISFDSSLLEGPPSPPSLSKDFSVFPPLQRSGRKIDDLVDEVIRKSSRYNPESLRLAIPPSDFEFHMPSHVSACGSPTRDSRFISSPENRNLAVAAIYNATTSPPTLEKPKLIPFGDSSVPPQSQGQGGDMHEGAPSSPAAQYHLGDVTHSDWFENSSGGHDGSLCRSGVQHQSPFTHNNIPTNGYGRRYDREDSDEENCDDMYIDS